MRHIAESCLVVAIAFPLPGLAAQSPVGAAQSAAAGRQTVVGGTLSTGEASISGTVVTPGGDALARTTVQARDLLTGRVDGSTTTANNGAFSIGGLNPGSYVVEVVDRGGQIIGTSAFVSAPAGAAVTSATVVVTTGALSAVSTAATGLAATLGATARTLSMAAAAAGVAGVVAPPEIAVASPSR